MKYITINEAGEITGMYLEAQPDGCVELSDDEWARVGPGYRYIDGALVEPPPSAPPTPNEKRKALKEAATAKRWAVETGGITLPNGVRINTGSEDQARITSVVANARLAGVESVDFKSEQGWVSLTVTEIEGIAAAVALHVQACFSAERAHHEAIAALPDSALDAYDINQGWPDA